MIIELERKNAPLGVRAMIMGQDLSKVENQYDTIAKKWAETFSGEHDNKPKDQEILHRFSQEIGDRRLVWDFGCGPGNTTKYLKNLGIEISGLDLSEKRLEQARIIHPEIHFRKGNILELEFENDSIAGVVAFYAIVHFTEEQVGIAFRNIQIFGAPNTLDDKRSFNTRVVHSTPHGVIFLAANSIRFYRIIVLTFI